MRKLLMRERPRGQPKAAAEAPHREDGRNGRLDDECRWARPCRPGCGPHGDARRATHDPSEPRQAIRPKCGERAATLCSRTGPKAPEAAQRGAILGSFAFAIDAVPAFHLNRNQRRSDVTSDKPTRQRKALGSARGLTTTERIEGDQPVRLSGRPPSPRNRQAGFGGRRAGEEGACCSQRTPSGSECPKAKGAIDG
jgi:hypothetical protein